MSGKWVKIYRWDLWGWLASADSGGLEHFEEGSPGDPDSPSEPNVAAQFLFDETSGSIVDEVAGLTLAVSGTPTPTYSVTYIGAREGMQPGIRVATDSLDTGKFQKTGGVPGWSPGLGNFTVEATYNCIDGQLNEMIFHQRNSLGEDTMYFNVRAGLGIIQVFLSQVSATVVGNFVSSVTVNDGITHKIRFVCTRASNLECFIDGVSQGTVDMTSLSAATFPAEDLTVGNYFNGTLRFIGVLYNLRMSHNNTNNFGGPGGG